jgi:hypothetical protein
MVGPWKNGVAVPEQGEEESQAQENCCPVKNDAPYIAYPCAFGVIEQEQYARKEYAGIIKGMQIEKVCPDVKIIGLCESLIH